MMHPPGCLYVRDDHIHEVQSQPTIEPGASAWEALILPLNQECDALVFAYRISYMKIRLALSKIYVLTRYAEHFVF